MKEISTLEIDLKITRIPNVYRDHYYLHFVCNDFDRAWCKPNQFNLSSTHMCRKADPRILNMSQERVKVCYP